VKNQDKPRVLHAARILVELGFKLVATRGTAAALAAAGLPVTPVNKVAEGRPHIVDMIVNDEIALVVNTVEEKRSAIQDSYVIRRAALNGQVPTYTTIAGARAAAIGMQGLRELVPYATQALHRRLHCTILLSKALAGPSQMSRHPMTIDGANRLRADPQ